MLGWDQPPDDEDPMTYRAAEGRAGRVPYEVGFLADVIPSSPVLDTAAYSSGDVIAETTEIQKAMRFDGGTGQLSTLTLIDVANQGAALDIWLLSSPAVMGTKNSAPSLNAAGAREVLDIVRVSALDYVTANSMKVACLRPMSKLRADQGSKSIYYAIVSNGSTPTYGAADALMLRFGIDQD